VRPVLRRFLVAVTLIASVVVLAVGWIAIGFLFNPCEYVLTDRRVSPSERYVVEIYNADCGLSSYRTVAMVRDLSALALPRVDGTPAGELVASDFTPSAEGSDIFWESETMLVIQYAGRRPALAREEWGGVRIEMRPAS
jgi:hypothetical protein